VLVDIAREPMTGIAPFAIPFDPASFEEPEEVDELEQIGLFDGLLGGTQTGDDDEDEDVDESDEYLD